MFHAEVVRRDGRRRSATCAPPPTGSHLGGAVGLAMIEAGVPVTPDWLQAGSWEVEIAGRKVPAIASLRPLYDPKMDRVRG
jgi:glycine cleavage system aminomethyltransferase T